VTAMRHSLPAKMATGNEATPSQSACGRRQPDAEKNAHGAILTSALNFHRAWSIAARPSFV